MQSIVDFFGNPLFVILSGIILLTNLFVFFGTVFFWFKGLVPILYRLGLGLSKRKIAIFAEGEFDGLKDLLVDSNLFKEKNIIPVRKDALKKSKGINLMLVHYKPFEGYMKEIIDLKDDADALIVYAPRNEGNIDDEWLDKINSERNAIVVNFRGRLLNDILVSMVTTSYK
ncbi:MAG TPA: hypothetical protein ENJ07_01980 [Gammaproteobacteria bacterium]|nr:hypothetical protein [Gammaproteobacteria bacterium]